MQSETSCGMVVFREKEGNREYLLLHYPGGHWDFPKGHVEKGERKHETAMRELEEETGITAVKMVPGFREHVHYTYRKNNALVGKTVWFFLGKTSETGIQLSHEHQGFAWLPLAEAKKTITFENARGVLQKAAAVLEARNKGFL